MMGWMALMLWLMGLESRGIRPEVFIFNRRKMPFPGFSSSLFQIRIQGHGKGTDHFSFAELFRVGIPGDQFTELMALGREQCQLAAQPQFR